MIRPSFHKPRPQDLLFPGPDPTKQTRRMTVSSRAPRRSHGILQHGGGGAAGRLVPLPAGEQMWTGDLQDLAVLRSLTSLRLPWAPQETQSLVTGSAEAGAGAR